MARYSSEMSTGSGVLGPENRLFAVRKGFNWRCTHILGFHNIEGQKMIQRRANSPWISEKGFTDHEPMGSGISFILQQVVIYAHIPIADNRYLEIIFQSLNFVQPSCTLSSSASRYSACMQSYPRGPRRFESLSKFKRLRSWLAESYFCCGWHYERMGHCGNCKQTKIRTKPIQQSVPRTYLFRLPSPSLSAPINKRRNALLARIVEDSQG